MAQTNGVHDLLIARLASRAALNEEDRAAVRDLSIPVRDHKPHARLAREGDRPTSCGFIVSGFAFRAKTTAAGGRQIVALLMPGDLIDLQQIVLPRADHDVEALTPMTVGDIPAVALQKLALGRPAIGRAIWVDTLIEASIMRELLLNNGRRDAVERVAHQLCEFAYRLASGDEPLLSFNLPVTQEQLGDMNGLTGVHINRTLKTLRKLEVIMHVARRVTITDWPALARLAMFTPQYLHRDAIGQIRTHAAPGAARGMQPPGAGVRDGATV